MLTRNWTKAKASDSNGSCLLVRGGNGGTVEVSDSKLGDQSPILTFKPNEWDAFLDGARKGEFDR
jgi:hypothetical protein